MCLRFSAWHLARIARSGYDLSGIVGVVDFLSQQTPRYNVALTTEMPVIEAGSVHLSKFGVVGANGRLIGNARSDQLGRYWKRYLQRRCLIPADGYYEWTADKQPWYFTHRELEVMCFAGIETGSGFLIITVDANAESATVHERMPAILEPAAAKAWLDPETTDPATLAVPLPPGRLVQWRVGKAVGNVRNEGPELIEPLSATLF